MSLGQRRQRQGNIVSYLAMQQEAVEISAWLVATGPPDPEEQLSLARTRFNLGGAFLSQDSVPSGVAMLRAAMATFDSIAASDPTKEAWAINRFRAKAMCGFMLRSRPSYRAEGIALLWRAIEEGESLQAHGATSHQVPRYVATARLELSDDLWKEGQFAQAADVVMKAVSQFEAMARADTANVEYQFGAAAAKIQASRILPDAGDPEAARRLLDAAGPEVRKLSARDTTDIRIRQAMALSLQARAGIARASARSSTSKVRAQELWQSARDFFVRSRDVRRAIPGRDTDNSDVVEDSLAGAGIAGCGSALAALAR